MGEDGCDISRFGHGMPFYEAENLRHAGVQVEYHLKILLSQGKLHCQHLSSTLGRRLHDLLAYSEALAVAALQHLDRVLPQEGILATESPEDLLMGFVELKVAQASDGAGGPASDTSEEEEEEESSAPSRSWAGREPRGLNLGQVANDWWSTQMTQLAEILHSEGLG